MENSIDFTFYCKLNKEPGTTTFTELNRCIQNMFNLPRYYNCIDNIKFNTRLNCAFIKVIKVIEDKIDKKEPYSELYRDIDDTNIIVYPYYSVTNLKDYKSPKRNYNENNNSKRQCLEIDVFRSPTETEKKQYLEIDVFKSNIDYIDVKPQSETEIKLQVRRSIYEEIDRLDTELNISKINAEELKIRYDSILNEISKLEELKQNKINEITKLF